MIEETTTTGVRIPDSCPRCGRTLPVAAVSPCPVCDPRERDAMLDPSWTPAAGYSHAGALLVALAKADAERSLPSLTEGR
jgi:hypothetical protein